MRYCVEFSESLVGIEERVNYMIQHGWIPQGGVCRTTNIATATYTQAMVNPMLPAIYYEDTDDEDTDDE